MENQEWLDLLTGITRDLDRLEWGLVLMKGECLRLEADGMWPAVPSESWETRGTLGETRYLRLVFGRDRPADHPRKVYVGCDPDKVREARKLASNRRQWEKLDAEITRLERFLQMMRGDLKRVAGSVERWQLPEGLDLVTDLAAGGDVSVTKGEWVLTGAPEVEYNYGQADQVCGSATTEP